MSRSQAQNRNNQSKGKSNKYGKQPYKGKQGKKDSNDPRINLDNARESTVVSDIAKDNDYTWYTKNQEMLNAAASYNFSQITGAPLGFTEAEGIVPQTVPGVMALYFYPTIGGYSDNAVNVAKENLYSFVVHANSRRTSYSSNDMMIMVLAGKDLFAAIQYGVRAYGVMKDYNSQNMYLPRAQVEAMGFNFEDLQDNLSNMWFDLNQFIAESRQIWVPNTMPIIKRGIWLNEGIYCDAVGIKAQRYIFVQDRFWCYNDTLTEAGGGLSWATYTNSSGAQERWNSQTGGHTWKEYVSMVRNMINSLTSSTYRGVMMGDILKAYGEDKIFALNELPVGYRVVADYNEEVLSQIENATVCASSYAQIEQDMNDHTIVVNWGGAPQLPSQMEFPLDQNILNFHFPQQPTPAQIMVATRFKAMGLVPIYYPAGHERTGLMNIAPDTCGTEVMNKVRYYWFSVKNSKYTLYRTDYPTVEWNQKEDTHANTTLPMLAFDWCPWLYGVYGEDGFDVEDAELTVNNVILPAHRPVMAYGDYDNFSLILKEDLRKMHTTAVFSEFDVPIV